MSIVGKFSFGAFSILVAAVIINIYWNRDSPIVTLISHKGLLQGRIALSREGTEYYEFLGIPFGEPPVGDLRFQSASPSKGWDGVRTAKSFGSNCLHFDMVTLLTIGEEDCLYLNVMTHNIGVQSKHLMPVMVFIHGGYYMSGSGDIWRGKYLMDQDIVLVTINYRLGALGFLNAGNELARGNMGLKDQVLALKWVQENIAAFGGDKDAVLIFGQSAGGSCVHLQMLSPMSKGLFHRAISQSGTVLSAWAFTNEPQEQANRLAKQLNCSKKTSHETVHCLRKIPATDIINVHREHADFMHDPLAVYKPSIESINDDEAFLVEHPLEIMKSNRIPNKVPWIVGANKDDGVAITAGLVRNASLLNVFENEWKEMMPKMLFYKTSEDSVPEKIRRHYFGHEEKIAKLSNMKKFAKLFSDRQYFIGIHQSALYHSKSSPVFGYVFSEPTELSFANIIMCVQNTFHPMVYLTMEFAKFWILKILGMKQTFYGVSHVDELAFLFNIPLFPQYSHSNENYVFSLQMVQLWTSFAKNGKPAATSDGLMWPQINPMDEYPRYLNLSTNSSILKGPFAEAAKFWSSLSITDR